MKQTFVRLPGVLTGLLVVALPVAAIELISNGGFEAGLSGWTRVDQLGSDGTFSIQTGATSPVNGLTVPLPPEGTFAAMSDAQGPGSHVLYQDFVVPTAPFPMTLSFSLFLNNSLAGQYAVPTPPSLDFSGIALNQQARVDIMTTLADTLSVAPGDVLLNAYQSMVGDPLVSGYNTIAVDVTSLFQAHLGQTLRLRFAEVDNLSILNMGVDNVRLAVPEAATLFPCTVGLAGLIWFGSRSRRTKRLAFLGKSG